VDARPDVAAPVAADPVPGRERQQQHAVSDSGRVVGERLGTRFAVPARDCRQE
jgi:hypothetical protein